MKQVQSKNVERYGVFEVTFDGKTEGNPFVDAHVSGTFSDRMKPFGRMVSMTAAQPIKSASCHHLPAAIPTGLRAAAWMK